MIKRLILLFVLVCTALSQGAIAIPPYMLSESLRESRAHGAELYKQHVEPNGDVVYRASSGELGYILTYCRGSLIKVQCNMWPEDVEDVFLKFANEAELGFGHKGKFDPFGMEKVCGVRPIRFICVSRQSNSDKIA